MKTIRFTFTKPLLGNLLSHEIVAKPFLSSTFLIVFDNDRT